MVAYESQVHTFENLSRAVLLELVKSLAPLISEAAMKYHIDVATAMVAANELRRAADRANAAFEIYSQMSDKNIKRDTPKTRLARDQAWVDYVRLSKAADTAFRRSALAFKAMSEMNGEA
jgi:hypothetical protein